MAKVGAKPKKIDDEVLERIESLAAHGLTNAQIAHNLGWAESTFYDYKAKKSEISAALEKGKAQGIEEVANALYESAKGGNVVAQIFFLKNRAPQEWRDKRELEVNDAPEKTNLMEFTDQEIMAEFANLRKEIKRLGGDPGSSGLAGKGGKDTETRH